MIPRAAWRGDRRLRINLDVGAKSARVASIWLVDGPAVQRPALSGPYIARIDVNGETVLLQSLGDPMIMRGIARPKEHGHHYLTQARGSVVIDVPLSTGPVINDISVRIADLGKVRNRPTDYKALVELFDVKVRGFRLVASVGAPDLAMHPDWDAVATLVGIAAVTTGGFEIYVDRAGQYRWRLRRPDGQIVADSGQGYRDRAACEFDLRWIRSSGLQSPIRSLDIN